MDRTTSKTYFQRHSVNSQRAKESGNRGDKYSHFGFRLSRSYFSTRKLFRRNFHLPVILCLFFGLFSFQKTLGQQVGSVICWDTNFDGVSDITLVWNGAHYENNSFRYNADTGQLFIIGFSRTAHGNLMDCETGEALTGLPADDDIVDDGKLAGEYDEANAENLEEIAATLEEILDEIDGGESPYLTENLPTDYEKPVTSLINPELEYHDENEIPEIENLDTFQQPQFSFNSGGSLGVIELSPEYSLDIGSSYNELSGQWGFKDLTTYMAVFSILIFTFYRAQTMFAH